MKKILPIIVIVIVCAIFFYPTILSGKLPVPADTLVGLYHPWRDLYAATNPRGVPYKNFLITDPVRQQIPWRKLAIDDLTRGKFPLWNPYNFSGTPLLANIQAGTFYPLNLFFFFLPFDIAWTALIMIQPILAALFLYLYLRRRNVSSSVAVFGGIIWAFCGFSIAWLTWGTIVQTALWLPLMLLAIDTSSIVLFVVASACTLFAGHTQVALYSFAMAAVYGLAKRSWRIGMVIALVATIIITSVQWVPMMQFIAHSSRITDAAAWLKDGWFLPWQNLVQFVAPDFFGNPATGNYRGVWNYGEFIGYIGILPLLFAIFATVARKDRLTKFFTICAGIVFLFLLPTPLARLPYQLHMPVISSLQPTRLMMLVDVCLVMLAALGFDAYLRKPDKKIWYAVGFLVLSVLALWWYAGTARLEVSKQNLILPGVLIAGSIAICMMKRWKNLFIIAVIGITVFDLFRFGWKFTPFTPVAYFFPTTNAISFLQGQQKPFRVMSLDNRILPPNVNAYYGIESIEGYDPIYDARYEEFIAALNRREPNITPPFGFNRIITVSTIESPLVALLNVKYILTFDDIKNPDLELMYREGNTRIYWYKKALPRIYPVESVLLASSKEQAISVLYDKTFNPRKTAIVEDHLELKAEKLSDADGIGITSYTDTTLTAASRLGEDHFVVITNIFDSGWKAYIDSKLTPIYRTNYLFQGIVVPEGDHMVVVRREN
jgi:hypothetical protein